MAKKEEAIVDQRAETFSMDRPSYLKGSSTEGTEHITKDDLTIPRLALAQQMSPELVESDAKFIPGLKVGDFFNKLTNEILGKGPLLITPVRADRPRGVEFVPLKDGGGIKDFNVPLTDPRMMFGPDGAKPIATKFYDFFILLHPLTDNPLERLLVISLKGTGLKTARDFNGLIKMRNAPLYTGVYSLTSAMQKNPKGTFAVYRIANAGFLDQARANYAHDVFTMIANKEIHVDREPGEDDDIEDL